MRRENTFRPGDTVGPRKGKPVQRIRLDGEEERLFVRAVDETCFDALLATQLRRRQAMHPVNDTMTVLLDEYGRKSR
jgi:hypothetical protein